MWLFETCILYQTGYNIQAEIMRYFTFIFCLFTSISNQAFSQLNLTIKFNKNLDPQKIQLFYLDGEVNKFIKPKFVNNTALINEAIKSKYARLIVNYPDKLGRLLGLCFLVTKGISTLEFKEVADSNINPISNYKVKNVYNVDSSSIYDAINNYTKNELKEFNRFNAAIEHASTDSLLKLRSEAYEKLAFKQIEYIELHSTDYFYFEKFINEIVPSLKSKYLAEMYEIFNANFPVHFKETYEGKSVKKLLEGNLYVKVGMNCPKFKTTDYLGNEINSEKLKGKYFLLSFWATWCSPCVKEIPQLKNIRDSYDENKLSIISVSHDSDSTKFIDGITNYKMNWIHVFNSSSMKYLFGQKPIPSVYLIDNNGKIIFSSWEKSFSELDVILKNGLSN